MSRNQSPPRFPQPPPNYDQKYFSDMVRTFFLYQQLLQNPGEGRNTFTVFTNLQTDDYGLEIGTVFTDGVGNLKVVIANRPSVRGVQATGGVGQITKAP